MENGIQPWIVFYGPGDLFQQRSHPFNPVAGPYNSHAELTAAASIAVPVRPVCRKPRPWIHAPMVFSKNKLRFFDLDAFEPIQGAG